jgi:hypothetical protein
MVGMSQSSKRRELTRQAPAPRTIVDPLADMQTANIVLKAGQWAAPADQPGVVYLGDGVTAFNSLSPFGGTTGGGDVIGGTP